MSSGEQLSTQLETILEELVQAGGLQAGQLVVMGVSTSEIGGYRIGTSGAEEAAAAVFEAVQTFTVRTGLNFAFQCCEHLNRALVVERSVMEHYRYEEVSVIPVPQAGGAMAAYAYRHMDSPCLVERIAAHAGIDIGDTLIGMHLRPVAVPFRPSIRHLGLAHVTMAYTRPKLIGGARAQYALNEHRHHAGINQCT